MEQGKTISPKVLKTTQGSIEWQDANGRVICILVIRNGGVTLASFSFIICRIRVKLCFKPENDLQRF